MDTPTSRVDPDPFSLTADAAIEELKQGRIDQEVVTALSDLSRQQTRSITTVWPTLPGETRQSLLQTANDLSASHVDLDFGRLFRVALDDNDASIRLLAIAGLADDASRSCRELMLRLAVTDPSVDVQAAALANLTDSVADNLDPDEDDPFLEGFGSFVARVAGQDDAPFAVRVRAIEALGVLPQSIETRALINSAWEHGDSALAVAALLAIARSRESRWLSLVRPELTSEDAEIRFAAVRALGGAGTTDDVEALATALVDDDVDVRLAAIAALGEIAGPGAVRVLRNYDQRAPEDEKAAIAEALDAALIGSEPRP